jgi:hypothetical protein
VEEIADTEREMASQLCTVRDEKAVL